MYSQWAQPQSCNWLWGLLKKSLKAGCLLSLSLFALATHAQWQDPLNTPSFKTQRSHESLLLDIHRAESRLVAVGSYGHIIYSDDNGKSWEQADVPVSITLTSVYFASGKIGWAAGHDGIILKTSDAGKTWQKQFDGYRANQEIVDSITRAYQAAEEALVQLEEQGDAEQIAAAQERLENLDFMLGDASYDLETGSTKPFLDLWFYDVKRGFAVGAYGMLFYTEDGGQHWQNYSLRLPNPDNFHLNAISFVGGQGLMITGERGLLLRSDNLGQTWRELDSPYDGSLFGLAANGNQQLLFGLRGHVFVTNDGGITWSELNTGSKQTLAGGLVTKHSMILVGNGGVVLNFAQNNQVKLSVVEGSKAYSSIAQAVDGTFVLVGEAGVMRVNANAELIEQTISMVAGDN